MSSPTEYRYVKCMGLNTSGLLHCPQRGYSKDMAAAMRFARLTGHSHVATVEGDQAILVLEVQS